MVGHPPWLPLWQIGLLVAVAASLAVLVATARPAGSWGATARQRFVLGIPWGTLIAVVGVAGFYFLVQDGSSAPRAPVTIPFRSWSYFYPLGILTASFAHAGLSHLVGNLLGTVVFGTLAEYAWSHFPRRRGSASFSSLRTNPFVRILAFVIAVCLVGIAGAAFGLGPVIGFSGVVFAFVGFAIVRYPLATIVGLVGTRVLSLAYNSIRDPVTTTTASREIFERPWWAEIAVQGHALGLFIGILLGLGLLRRRGRRPNTVHVYLAVLLFAVDRGLWAIYTIHGTETFTLYRAFGLALVFVLAALIAANVGASARLLVARIDLTRREAVYGVLLATLFALALVAVPFNLYVVDDPNAGFEDADSVEVRDYTVFYAEDIEHQFIPAVPLPGSNESGGVPASGVIVVSDQRNLWWEVISENSLASNNRAVVRLGGVDWHRNVRVTRTTWRAVGGNETYLVRLGTGTDLPVVYRSGPAQADIRLDGRNVSIEPVDERFEVVVSQDNETVGRLPIPEDGDTASQEDVVLERDGRTLYIESDGTRVQLAERSGH